ncbi:hypothetical protein JOC34_000455 [Virgibacillus halotolerans]|uniref:hypothetical protein n=1 Tax=Virgibacillus halotolerans TaxID=1071053 RepID=UPI001961B393|nr:hypothetical protein [Virgibacillus halotolerans]MBM7598098.1 hypothetical protein [Virgibacillus halotolerans]
MFNFVTISAYNHVRNNPRCKAQEDLVNGLAVTLDEVAKEANLPDTEGAKGTELFVVFNIIDKPEIRNSADFKVEKGEFVRAFLLHDAKELPVEVGTAALSGQSAVGDKLVVEAGTGKWVKAGEDDDHAIQLEVTAKTPNGVEAIVKA